MSCCSNAFKTDYMTFLSKFPLSLHSSHLPLALTALISDPLLLTSYSSPALSKESASCLPWHHQPHACHDIIGLGPAMTSSASRLPWHQPQPCHDIISLIPPWHHQPSTCHDILLCPMPHSSLDFLYSSILLLTSHRLRCVLFVSLNSVSSAFSSSSLNLILFLLYFFFPHRTHHLLKYHMTFYTVLLFRFISPLSSTVRIITHGQKFILFS